MQEAQLEKQLDKLKDRLIALQGSVIKDKDNNILIMQKIEKLILIAMRNELRLQAIEQKLGIRQIMKIERLPKMKKRLK